MTTWEGADKGLSLPQTDGWSGPGVHQSTLLQTRPTGHGVGEGYFKLSCHLSSPTGAMTMTKVTQWSLCHSVTTFSGEHTSAQS